MKRVYLLILALVAWMAVPAQAQFKWGIKGGANISSIHFSDLPETFSTDCQYSNGAIIGSLFVRLLDSCPSVEEAVKDLKKTIGR